MMLQDAPRPRNSARRSPTAGNHGHGSKWLKPTTRRRIYERDDWRCVWCTNSVAQLRLQGVHGMSVEDVVFTEGVRISQATVDHVVPRARGGSNRPANLITACAGCNAARGHRSVPAFAATLCDRLGMTDEADRSRTLRRIVRRVRAAQRRKLP